MNHAVLLAQLTAEMPPIPPWLINFAIGALCFATLWMSLLVRHAAREERQYKEQLKQQEEAARNAHPDR